MNLGEQAFLALQRLLPRRGLSSLVGWLTRLEAGALTHFAIRAFVAAYKVDMRDAAEPDISTYPSFNRFFTRALAPDARPLPEDPQAFVSPADGTLSEIGEFTPERMLRAKGLDYGLTELLGGDADLAARFAGGSFATVYLAPYNYHRVHLPWRATPRSLRFVPGELYSVNATTVRLVPGLFCRNERMILACEDDAGRWFALVLVGALNVGSIELTVPAGATNRPQPTVGAHRSLPLDGPPLARGAEIGRFNMGSTVVVLASPGWLEWRDLAVSATVRMGETLARALPGAPAATGR
ncbi:MAG: archaetidylserine decarboxylase [Gammaproteobacteria bacterium]